jgi:glycosyltransferase involved in cell wall biosynthesis
VVATDCPTGPREVLQDGKYGFLVPMHDPRAMADAIAAALDWPTPRDKLEEAIASFGKRAVLDRHFELLGIDGKNRTGDARRS